MDIDDLVSKVKTGAGVHGVGDDTRKITKYAAKVKGKKVLDLGTGSGFTGIYFALNGRNVTASDISVKSLEIARKNAVANKAKVKFVKSDLYANIKDKFDLIVFNPPVGNASGNPLIEFVKSFIPKNRWILWIATKLFSGDRKELLGRFFLDSVKHLNKKGKIVTILHLSEKAFVENLIGKRINVLYHDKGFDYEVVRIDF